MNDKETYYKTCESCGRPMAYCKGQCCGKPKGCQCKEYCGSTCAAIRPGEPKCPPQAVIPSLTVESVSNLKDLADCFVHVSDINTTFYIDDKHRIMTTWAGLVSVEDYDFAANPLNLRGQIAYDAKNNTAAIYDKQGANYIFQISDINNDYMLLENKPQINGVTLEGNKTSADLGVPDVDEVALVFDTVADMKLATNLANGSYARTLGFHTIGDGGGAIYKIGNSGTANEMDIIAVDSLYATLVKPTIVTPQLYGAYGDGTHDDTLAIQRCMDTNSSIVLDKTYLITAQLNYNGKIDGLGTGVLKTNSGSRISGAFIRTTSSLDVENLNFDCTSVVPFANVDKFIQYNNAIFCNNASHFHVNNCHFNNLYNVFIEIDGSGVTDAVIENSTFSSDNKTNPYFAAIFKVENIFNSNANIVIKNNICNGYEYEYVSATDNDTNINAAGIFLANVHPNNISIIGNTFDHLGRYGNASSRIDTIDFYYNVTNATVKDNNVINCHWTPLRLHGTTNAVVDNNYFSLARTITECYVTVTDGYNSTGELPVTCDNVKITNNTFDVLDSQCEQGIQVNGYGLNEESVYGIYGEVHNLIISNNLFTGKTGFIKRVIWFDGSLKELYLSNNTFDFPSTGGSVYVIAPVNLSYYTSSLSGSSMANTYLYVDNNTFNINGPTIYIKDSDALNAIYQDLHLDFYHNILRSLTNAGYCIYGPSSTADIKAIGNIMRGTGGISGIHTAINNVIYHKSTGVAVVNVTTNTNNEAVLFS